MMDTNIVNDTVGMNAVPTEMSGVSPAPVDVAPVNNEVGAQVDTTSGDGILPTIDVSNTAPVEPIPVVEQALEQTEPQVVEVPVDATPVNSEVSLPTDSLAPTNVETSAEPVVLPTEEASVPVDAPAQDVPTTPLEPTVEVENANAQTPTENNDNFISVLDDSGKEYKAEVIDIFQVSGYEGNNYIIYSFGEKIDADTDKVYVSKIEELADGTINLNAIVDNSEWESVNNAINEKINAVGGA